MNSPRTFPLAKPLLRYQADWRSLFFLIVLTFCFAIEWTGFCRGWPLRVFTCFLAIVACNVKHNQMHCRMFHSALLNTLLNYWLGFCTGTTTTDILTEHNERHHGHINEEVDYVRTTLVNFRSQILNVLFFFPRAFIRLQLEKPSDLKRWRRTNRLLFWQSLSEKIVLYSGTVALLLLDWKATAIFVLLPWLNGQWWLFTFGLFQHQDMDGESPYNNSRNITSVWFNWFYINIGFHSAHHFRPGVHWSLLPELHRLEIAPHLDPSLDEKSMVSFYWNWFAGKHRQRRAA
jgi:beta-carotene hydroxylase